MIFVYNDVKKVLFKISVSIYLKFEVEIIVGVRVILNMKFGLFIGMKKVDEIDVNVWLGVLVKVFIEEDKNGISVELFGINYSKLWGILGIEVVLIMNVYGVFINFGGKVEN